MITFLHDMIVLTLNNLSEKFVKVTLLTMVFFSSKANVVFTPRAEDVSCEENISRNAAQFFGLIANSKYRQVQNLS